MMNVKNAWRELSVWCAIGVAAIGFLDPASCFAAWAIGTPIKNTPPTPVTSAKTWQMTGTGGPKITGHTYLCRLYNTASSLKEGEGTAAWTNPRTNTNWAGSPNLPVGLFTLGDAFIQIWDNTASMDTTNVTVI